MDEAREHWDGIWSAKAADEVSWYEVEPATWLGLIGAVAPSKDSRIVDVGGGASRLVDCLLDEGYRHVTVVDLSEAALERARGRLGARAASVAWLAADARYLRLPEQMDVWHDRAVFHFLTEDADRRSYLGAVGAALRVGGYAVVATFGLAGPEKCSGLPVNRYDAAGLAEVFGPDYELATSLNREHVTPGGGRQEFTYAVLLRLR